MNICDAPLAERIEIYLKAVQKRDARVIGLTRIHGGASRETYRVRLDEGGRERGFILRRDPTSALIDTDRNTEYEAYRAFFKTPVPVPEALALEDDPQWMERPFSIMEEIENAVAGSFMRNDHYGAHGAHIGKQFFTILGEIARQDPREIGIGWDAPSLDQVWAHEVRRWEKVIDEDEREPQPIARAAIRWMRRNPPPPAAKLSFVHGDYRTGNFLYNDAGDIKAILDWEMAHLGDPLEDLGWALDPVWIRHDRTAPQAMCTRDEAIAYWEAASGLKVDLAALRWWSMFASFKGVAIWISAAAEVADGKNVDPVNTFSGWYLTPYHNQLMAERLAGTWS